MRLRVRLRLQFTHPSPLKQLDHEMKKKSLLLVGGSILLLAPFIELLTIGGLGVLYDCGLAFDCFFSYELASLEIGIVLAVLGVLAILT